MMTKDQIAEIMDPIYPGVYTVTNAPTTLYFDDGIVKVGFFVHTHDSDYLEKENKYTFVENEKAQQWKATNDTKYITVIDANHLTSVHYKPS
jgi:hypothetical protein